MSHTDSLNPRQRRFVEEYLKTLNAEEAYRRAGYASGNGTGLPKRMFALPAVRAAIDAGLTQSAKAIEVDARRVITRYMAIAFASIGDFVAIGRDGTLEVGPSTIDPDSLPALTTFDVSEYRTPKAQGGERVRRVKIGIASKLRALDALARHLGLFKAKRKTAAGSPVVETADTEAAPDMARPLDARRARFVAEYLSCANATRAYIRAGHKATPAAHHHAWRLMARPDVRAAIEAGQRRLARHFTLSAERIVIEYARIGFANMADYVDVQPDGCARIDLSKAPRERLAALRQIVIEEYCDRPPEDAGRVKHAHLTLTPKLPALHALARHLGVFDQPDPLDGLAEDLRAYRLRDEAEAAEARAAAAAAHDSDLGSR